MLVSHVLMLLHVPVTRVVRAIGEIRNNRYSVLRNIVPRGDSRPFDESPDHREELVSVDGPRGLAADTEPEVEVCLLPGTEVAFDQKVRYAHPLGWLRSRTTKEELARFRQVNMDNSHTHHDAFEFPSGKIVTVTRLVKNPEVDCASAPIHRARCK